MHTISVNSNYHPKWVCWPNTSLNCAPKPLSLLILPSVKIRFSPKTVKNQFTEKKRRIPNPLVSTKTRAAVVAKFCCLKKATFSEPKIFWFKPLTPGRVTGTAPPLPLRFNTVNFFPPLRFFPIPRVCARYHRWKGWLLPAFVTWTFRAQNTAPETRRWKNP